MSSSLRPPYVPQNARPITTLSSTTTISTPRRLFLRRNAQPPLISTKTTTTTQCYKYEENDYDEHDMDLEAEILEFMGSSSKPEAFPSRGELVEAGRGDLADAIAERGGWLSLGWDLENDGNHNNKEAEDNYVSNDDYDYDYDYNYDYDNYGGAKLDDEQGSSILPLYPYHKSSLDMKLSLEQEMGIEGILKRLEKERNFSFGLGVVQNEDEISTDTTVGSFFRGSSSKDKFSYTYNKSFTDVDGLTNSHKSQMWRSWSNQRAQVSERDIEDIQNSENDVEAPLENESSKETNEQNYLESRREQITNNELRSRLQNLELELSSVLRAVRSSGDDIVSLKDHESAPDDMQKIYDDWEFQENEIMRAQDKLRSTRAKLAVLEGKMALAIIEAQKIMEEKQKRIDDARRALRLLNSTCIVWPNPASEVLLAGSFDGWGTLRKMEKSSTGIFSLWLQLYPGKYEIKFIVDGEWRIDPQRLTIDNNGYLNNLLIIS